MPDMNKLFLLTIFSCLVGGCCTTETSNIRHNLLMTGQCQWAFLKEWGYPTKTFTQSGSEKGVEAAWGPGGGRFTMNPKRTYDLWFYEKRGVTLAFYRQELAGWKWDTNPPQ